MATQNNVQMEKIKYLFKDISTSSLPNIIYDELCKYGNKRVGFSFLNENGERVMEYGKLTPPFYTYYDYSDFGFYCLEKLYDRFITRLENGNIFDVEYNQLDITSIEPYFREYSKGFQSAYDDYENTLKNNSLFSLNNEEIAYKVFSRVYRTNETGGFALKGLVMNEKKEVQIKNKYNIDYFHFVTNENFYKSGKKGGEFYKAWELILNNPTIFLPIFKDNITQKESESDAIKIKSIKWKGSNTQLIALIKSLVESNVLDNSLTEEIILERFEQFFDTELKNYNQTKTKIRNRTKDRTPFIDKLKINLEQWIKAKD